MKRDLQRRETQAVLFDAAIELFDVQGYVNTSVEEICRSAGIGRATFFRHFETKAGLMREKNGRTAADARERIDELPGPSDAIDRLRAFADAVHDAWVDAGPGLRGLFEDSVTGGDNIRARLHSDLQTLVGEIMRDGRASGALSLELSPSLSAHLVIVYLAAATTAWFNNPDEDYRSLIDRALNQCLYGIAGAPGSRRASGRGRRA